MGTRLTRPFQLDTGGAMLSPCYLNTGKRRYRGFPSNVEIKARGNSDTT